MAEYRRVGLDAARVEDIVAAAGVSWGTFFHYFPTKEDVLLEAGAVVCQAFAAAAEAGLAAGQDTQAVLAQAFQALFAASGQVIGSRPLAGAMLRQVLNHPGRLTAYLGDEILAPVPATTQVLAVGQQRGEVRADEPAEALAVIVLYSVLFSAQRAVRDRPAAGLVPAEQPRAADRAAGHAPRPGRRRDRRERSTGLPIAFRGR